MTHKNTKNNGCLWLFIFSLVCITATVVISVFFQLKTTVSFVIAAILATIFTMIVYGKPSVSNLFRNVVVVFILVMGIRFALLSFFDLVKSTATETTFKIEEGVGKSTIVEGVDTVSVYSSHRLWKDNYGNYYEGDLTVRERDFLRLLDGPKNFKAKGNSNFWGVLYDYLDRNDSPSLDLVMKAFQQIDKDRKLNQMEFAEMVISCIQDIPYSYVFQEACYPASSYEEPIKSLLEDCPECCIGNMAYGIQNPVSFLQNLKGDCDTRTVLIYVILKHFKYDVAILNSDFYRHSIIGLNIPAKGLYKTYYGKKYVVWETTAKYYTAGQLPPNFNDLTHWNVVLTSK